MRLGRERGEQPDPHEESVSRTEPNKKVRVKVACELGIWLPCPRLFPSGHDAESWSRLASTVWWEKSSLPHDDNAVDQLAAVFRGIRETGYRHIHSHQFWIYLRDPHAQPMSVYICVWKQQGERNQRLRLLTGADDRDSVRKPQVAKATASHLGTGLRTARYRALDDIGSLLCMLNYAFRVEEHETDLQVFTSSTDRRALKAASGDIERFVQSIAVYGKTDDRPVAEL
jgi:hypothetical protein